MDINTLWFEIAIVGIIFAFGNIYFGHFEEQTPKWRRVAKLIMFLVLIPGISAILGREWAMGLLGVLGLFLIYVHGYVLPRKGINGLTGEPRDKYYEFRGWDKNKH